VGRALALAADHGVTRHVMVGFSDPADGKQAEATAVSQAAATARASRRDHNRAFGGLIRISGDEKGRTPKKKDPGRMPEAETGPGVYLANIGHFALSAHGPKFRTLNWNSRFRLSDFPATSLGPTTIANTQSNFTRSTRGFPKAYTSPSKRWRWCCVIASTS
jgi:hypothetical protein